jgi:RNA polymerase sigma factor (sigma-70 family)
MALNHPEAPFMVDGVVYVIDDDPAIRRSLSRLLRSHGRRVETFAKAREFFDKTIPPGPACIVLDLQLPDISGLDVQGLIGRKHETMPIVFISGHGTVSDSVRAMKAGAIDFLIKPFESTELILAIDSAIERSKRALDRTAALERDREAFSTLTERERQVCLRVAQGMLNKQIGSEFGTTEKTIKVHRGRVMQKLGAQSVADMVRLVERLRSAGSLQPLSKAQTIHSTGDARAQL